MEDKDHTDYCIGSVSSRIWEPHSTYYNQADQSKRLWSLLLEHIITVLGPYKGSIGSYFDLMLYFYSGLRSVICMAHNAHDAQNHGLSASSIYSGI